MTEPLKVFISYAHEDEAHRETLGKHLRALVCEGLIEICDRQITGGREWAGAIDHALRNADIVLLLISADFLHSDYCNDVELTEAIRMHDAGQARVVPAILRSCDWEKSQFARFNALPPDGAPVVEGEHPDQRFKAVAKGLRALVAESRASPAEADAALPEEGVTPTGTDTEVAPPTWRKITIPKLSLFGVIEIGPFDLWLPRVGRKTTLLGLGAVVLLLGTTAAGVYAFAVRGPLADARDAMRMARYDTALVSVSTVPKWLASWPGVIAMQKKAELGVGFQKTGQDWETLGKELRKQRAAEPDDADLMVLDATYWLRREDYDKARSLVEAALKADEKNAEAWFLLGLDRDIAGHGAEAAAPYRKAVDAAPDSPQYRSNLARALLETGKVDEAILDYRKVSQFPLARVEEALGHWSRGEMREAVGVQRDAVKMLNDTALQDSYYNRRAWMFRLPTKGVRLASLDDKRCYARLSEAASRRMAGETTIAFPPKECSDPPLEIRELVADDLCRFVDLPRPGLGRVAGSLRQALGQPEACPSPAAPESAPSARTS